MNIDTNKTDFEKALKEMKDILEPLDQCIDDAMMDTLRAVVREYEGHYQSDIQEAIDLLDSNDIEH